ncbi:MAG: peptide chain release factor N(5)-glutamine methyltransferase [Selenomonas sp.]|uniref:peptide chain release factor N(5)-glutamine methyltransferase n=1 Tax=Selenomonas sp. TaxID=2053611 RepID=UPI002601457F|nr:peptide chain release factor N(5)-glutamine methyltransferase [Selenomonas sp.]MCR5758649.1 peptide chain release factor N(5)-glutamine methyltransferase [Selenomonas sp.]
MAVNEIWTIGRILKWTEGYFAQKGIENPRLDAEVLLGHVLKKQRIYLYVHFDEPLQPAELQSFREMIKQRINHVPVAYILGEKEFMGLTFKVTKDTLVPRPDTEILVQGAVDRLRSSGREHVCIADIGTGTGAVGLSVLHFFPGAELDTVDISGAARAVAEENAAHLELTDRVHFFTGDLLLPLQGQTYDAILSNPPYIPAADISKLSADVQLSEPHTALDGGEDGLDFYHRLCEHAPAMLVQGGFMAFEVGINQAQAVAELAENNPLIEKTEILKDYAGIDRVVVAWKKEA